MQLAREEYIEQAYFFRAMHERMQQSLSTQDLLESLKHEVLSTTKLPLALDYMSSELRMTGRFGTAMAWMNHYFTPFQTYVICEAEKDVGRFDFRVGLEILQREAEYRSEKVSPQGIFLYEFETLCRNRLNYDHGLDAIAKDPIFDQDWKEWIRKVRQQVGIVDFADLIYVRSEFYRKKCGGTVDKPILFGEKEGKIALANRRKDPLYLFSALGRQLGYPSVPRPKRPDETQELIPGMMRRLERLEQRLKLLEEEQRGGIDLTRFYGRKSDNNSTG
ncbi:MAG: hypothetical protein HQ581_27985 [Planctomycetes bacterium]|nr:hypothetical protein [Planctomycetota bacterium]